MKRISLLAVLGFLPVMAMAAGFDGTWTATFDTQVGEQSYTYTFHVDGMEVTGKAVSANGEVEITKGKIENDTLTFVENLNYQGMELVITYTGKMTSDDEIAFTRRVADVATEELVARRKAD